MTEVEWYTPPWLVEAAREALGGAIDLDPASSAEANVTVRAKRYYTADQDGISMPWSGRVFCNPPHGRAHNRRWIMRAALVAPRCEAIVCLVPASPNAAWWRAAWESRAQCWLDGRPAFRLRGVVEAESPRNDYAVLYWGREPARFASAFGPYGTTTQVTQRRLAYVAQNGPLSGVSGQA